MKEHGTASHSSCIPTVVPYGVNESQKVVVIDVADIISVVGLMKQINGKVIVGKNTLYFPESYFVISPSTAFNSDMSKTAGKQRTLC